MEQQTQAHFTGGRLRPITVSIGGFKHALVQILAATIAMGRRVILYNVPDIADTRTYMAIINKGGGTAVWQDGTLTLDTRPFCMTDLPDDLMGGVHGTLYLLPAILGRFHKIRMGETGGCQIGAADKGGKRPVHHMLSILEKFGASHIQENSRIEACCDSMTAPRLDIMDFSDDPALLTGPLVSGATKTALLAGISVCHGTVIIENPYEKADVQELVAFLICCGYSVHWQENQLSISPPDQNAHDPDAVMTYQVMTCISEIMTYITLSVYAGVPLSLCNITTQRARAGLAAEMALLARMGVPLFWTEDQLYIVPPGRLHSLHIDVTSRSIYSDHQPLFALMLLRAEGPSSISERVWQDRFSYADELVRLGAVLTLDGNRLSIQPSEATRDGQTLWARDLRSAAVLAIATTRIQGGTRIKGIIHLERGYEALLDNIRQLGMTIDEEKHI